jgi:hypothetical protein
MAKALGKTVEEEHKTGLHKLAQVRNSLPSIQFQCLTASHLAANKRPSWLTIHRL